MKYNRYFFLGTFPLLTITASSIIGCKAKPIESQKKSNETDTSRLQRNSGVSIIDLVANPNKFNRQKIEVKGFIEIEFESTILYLHKKRLCKRAN